MNKKTLDDIFNDDDFGLLDVKPKSTNIKSEEDRLIDSFEEINIFIDKNDREPATSSMSEYSLSARLKNFRDNETSKKILKPFDRHNLLGYVELDTPSIDDIFNDDDLGLLETDNELDIFKFKHTPKPQERAETDFVAKRTPIKEKEFEPYERMFHQVHQELKTGVRKIENFTYESLKMENFYSNNGVLLYIENVEWDKTIQKFKSGIHHRPDGRCQIIFENGTKSNMRFQSLYKTLHKDNNGKRITEPTELSTSSLFVNADCVREEDIVTGWVYVLKSKSENEEIKNMKDLYKIGFSSVPVEERIKNAKNEATYLYADVEIVERYKCVNLNANKLETLLHKFFATACLNVDLYDDKGQRITPREWFVVPFNVIDEVIGLLDGDAILNYVYDDKEHRVRLK